MNERLLYNCRIPILVSCLPFTDLVGDNLAEMEAIEADRLFEVALGNMTGSDFLGVEEEGEVEVVGCTEGEGAELIDIQVAVGDE
jgi:hypothetical protein